MVNPDTGRLYEAGDILKRPKLARTLETIANKGVDAFYNGELSKDIAADIRDAGESFVTTRPISYFNLTDKWRTAESPEVCRLASELYKSNR